MTFLWPLRVCWPAASLSSMGTAVLLTARPYSEHSRKDHRCPSPLHPGYFPAVKLPVSWRTPPISPTDSSSSCQLCHQEDGTGASELALQDCSTAFSPRLWEPSTPITPPLSETSSTTLPPGTSHPPPPNTPHVNGKNSILSVLHTGEWAG